MIPAPLTSGSRVALVSPSGAVDPDLLAGAAGTLASWGLEPVVAPHAAGRFHRFAGTDNERLADLQAALNDPSLNAIWCARGGYGLCRIVDRLRLDEFKQHPKWVIGFSDITCLHGALGASGYGSLHAIMCKQLALQPQGEAAKSARRALFDGNISLRAEACPHNLQGTVTGPLAGGNLTVLTSLIGSPCAQIPDGALLLLEDIGEAPYRIDRMARQLRLSGLLNRIGGVVAGQFTDTGQDDSFQGPYGILREILQDYGIPLACGFPVGHTDRNLAVALGAEATLTVTPDGASLIQKLYS